ncbi:Arm DNA-binding domain-containing protein [Pseudomonas citronellolis]|nr:Arm DNA-binding domain-containing protein [Pseudomonas citronellolis]MDN6871466.1 Arm DNA-binding domain-containing protein [Pseudomonas citronellolis]
MPENLLTDLKVRSAKSTDRDWKLSDGGGLFLLVKPTGGKLWRWKYRLQGKENLFAIGGFPQVSLAEARAAREKARALVKQGIHRSRSSSATWNASAHVKARLPRWRRRIWPRSNRSSRSVPIVRKSPASGSTCRPSSMGCR